MTSFRTFLQENILSFLKDEEKDMMELLSAFDFPADPRSMIDLIDSRMTTIRSLSAKLLIRGYPDGKVDLHDSMKDGIRSSLSRKRYRKLRVLVKKYHESMSGDDDLVQCILLSSELGYEKEVVRSLLLHGDNLIGRGYLSLASLVMDIQPTFLSDERRIKWEILSHDCAIALGMEKEGKKHLKTAGELSEKLVRERNDRNSLQLTAMVLNRLAEHGLRQGSNADVIKRLTSSLRISRRIGALDQEARTLSNIGSAYLDLGQHEIAVRFLDDASSIFSKIGDQKGLAICRLNKGRALTIERDLPGALREYLECMMITRRSRDSAIHSMACFGVARLYRFVMEWDQAMKFYNDSVIGFIKMGDLDHAFMVLSEMAQVCSRGGNADELKRALERIKRIISDDGFSYLKERLGLSTHVPDNDMIIIERISNSFFTMDRDSLDLRSMIRKNYTGIHRKIRSNLLENFQALIP